MRVSPARIFKLALLALCFSGFLFVSKTLFDAEAKPEPKPFDNPHNENHNPVRRNEAGKPVAVKAEPQDRTLPYYRDVLIPKGWTDADWTGLPPSESAVASEQKKEEASLAKYAFNAYKSNKMSLRRKLPDFRHAQCNRNIGGNLPKTSVIICFVDEMWSSLFRTVWSVLDRTPKALLHEIILVNDASEVDWLREDLDTYMAGMPSIVRVIPSPRRLGLIRARAFGAEHATGDVLVFLDSHCEATTGWLEPMLERIHADRTTVVCPMIDSINDHTMDFHGGGGGSAAGSFHWTLDFTWIYETKPHGPGEPFESATMAGGLFAIDRSYWLELGTYDMAMAGWGGENLELSFRIWQCGGKMEFHPCSHVGHIFRSSHPYHVPEGFSESFFRNSKRLAEVWMDEYKEAFYMVRPTARDLDIGDISDRIALRERLKCKPFKTFLEYHFPNKFVPLPENMAKWGQLKSGNTCVDKLGHQHPGDAVGIYGCHAENQPSLQQAFILDKVGRLRTIWDNCLTAQGPRREIKLTSCQATNVWTYNDVTQELKFKDGGCLEIQNQNLVASKTCDGSGKQRWQFSMHLNV